MRKPTLIFILLLFAACAVVGYLLASKSGLGSIGANTGQTDAAASPNSNQQNFLLVRVDDLTAASPQLVEVWIVLTLYSDPPQVMFIPLYPSYDTAKNATIASSFALDSQGNLAGKLTGKVASMYGVNINGYIMTDTAGMNAIANWFGIDGITASPNPAQSDNETHALLLTSQSFLQSVCKQLKGGGALHQYQSIRWSELAPLHFQTDMSFEQFLASWDKVNHASAPQQCDVLSSE
jgi:hypothetical protein